jgi:hypothetical protein
MSIKSAGRWQLIVGFVAAAFAMPAASPAAEPAFAIELEAGPVWQSGNTVQIPNDQNGTRFSLERLVGSGPWPAARLYFNWDIKGRHGLRFLVAPLSYTESGVFDETVSFSGATFLPGVPTEATYKFNSWRLGYRYRFHQGKRWTWWVGATANIRDAKIELQQGSTTSRDTDVGFVPLFYIGGTVTIAPRWRMLFDFEGLAGGPGRVEDLALKFACDISERWSVTGGYRTVEGGADVDEVYNFAWFNAAVISGVYRF